MQEPRQWEKVGKREPLTKLNFGFTVHSLIKKKKNAEASMYEDTQNCFKLLWGFFVLPLKQVMQKRTNIHDSEPGQHLQTKPLLRNLLQTALQKGGIPVMEGASHIGKDLLEQAKYYLIPRGDH